MDELPLDCIGVIVSYTSSSRIFFNFLLVSKNVNSYLRNEPKITKHIKFIIRKKKRIQIPSALNYVHQLVVEGVVPIKDHETGKIENEDSLSQISDADLKMFPQLEKLELIEQPRVTDSIFETISKLKKLVLVECPMIGNDGFQHLSHTLKTLIVDRSHWSHSERDFKISGEKVFEHLPNLERLEISSFFKKFQKYSYLKLKKIKIFRADCTNVSSRILKAWKDTLEELSLQNMDDFNPFRFQHSKKLRKLVVKNVHRLNETQLKLIFDSIGNMLEEFEFQKPSPLRGSVAVFPFSEDDESDYGIMEEREKRKIEEMIMRSRLYQPPGIPVFLDESPRSDGFVFENEEEEEEVSIDEIIDEDLYL